NVLPKRNNIVCANAVSKNDLIELRLKDKVKKRMLGIETSGMKVKNLVLEEVVDTLLDANEVMLMAIEKELVDIKKAVETMASAMAQGVHSGSNTEVVRRMLMEIADGLGNQAVKPDAKVSLTRRTRTTGPDAASNKKLKVFNLVKDAEGQYGDLYHYREAHAVIPRLSYYIYGKHRVWPAWEQFRSEYEGWLQGLV
ncbi:MAG: hypothetical protein ACM3NT_07050, partial [Methylocystaceae bacterium]